MHRSTIRYALKGELGESKEAWDLSEEQFEKLLYRDDKAHTEFCHAAKSNGLMRFSGSISPKMLAFLAA